ncbi:hypothetical protein ARMSODRAFT_1053323 [Armillaria solidipes]|uniref:Ig-like domain-containing protein n=1 Tax=Armillaria solidipes TaxID=1076256 RepID=A0A2H3B823_9AGAR|nr:hypothetical protein ARMSODRAFT_1053323 [Armillaria solidipes]
MYIRITNRLFFYQQIFFLLLSSWRISAPPHIKPRHHTYAGVQTSTSPYHLTQGSQRRSTMDHHKEEHDDLLPPSGSNDGPSFPVSVPWSEAGHSSSSATLVQSPSTAGRIRLGRTLGVIAGLLFGAAVTAVLHHVYLSNLRGRTVSGQFWIKNSSNALSTLVQWLCMGSISVSLTQLIWYLLRRRPFTVLQLNHLFGLPDPLRILHLASSRRLWNAIPVITIATLLQAFSFVSILAPNSLEVGSALPENTTISVPTALFNKPINVFDCSVTPSADSEKVLSLALQSETLMGWNAPAGCGTACNYMIQYTAPALRCTELAIDEANTMLNVSTDSSDRIVYNAGSGGPFITPMSITWRTYDTNRNSTIGGTRCSLWNTTQKSVVSFVNNTGMIFPSIISYDSPVNTSLQAIIVVGSWLFQQLEGDLIRLEPEDSDRTRAYWYPSIDPPFKLATTNLFSLNETAGTFTPNSENVSSALEQILVNATVALITHWDQTTMVDASVAQDQLVWVYHVQRLWIIYATALAVTAACGAVGLVCILKNGEDSDLTFWDIVRATRNSELDAVVEGEKRGYAGESTMLQYAIQGRDLEANTSGVFVLARPHHKRSRSMDMGP